MIDHRLLHRMQRVAVGKILDGDELRAVELAEQQNAGVDRLIGQLAAAQAREHDRAGAAIALRRSPPSYRWPALLAQPVENRSARREALERDLPPAKPEAQRVAGLNRRCLQIHRCSSNARP